MLLPSRSVRAGSDGSYGEVSSLIGSYLSQRTPKEQIHLLASLDVQYVVIPIPSSFALTFTASQGTWQFTSAWLLDNPSAAVITADELESIFWIALYMSLRFLRHTCLNVATAMFDLFDQYDFIDTEYRCGPLRRVAVSTGMLPPVGGKPYEFLDDDNETDHPINGVIGVMLTWFHARYAKLTAPPDKNAILRWGTRKCGTGKSKKKVKVTPEQDELAQNLDDHTALLELLDDLLTLE